MKIIDWKHLPPEARERILKREAEIAQAMHRARRAQSERWQGVSVISWASQALSRS